jgi:hypothetical protein
MPISNMAFGVDEQAQENGSLFMLATHSSDRAP